jgi:hypothetical protein
VRTTCIGRLNIANCVGLYAGAFIGGLSAELRSNLQGEGSMADWFRSMPFDSGDGRGFRLANALLATFVHVEEGTVLFPRFHQIEPCIALPNLFAQVRRLVAVAGRVAGSPGRPGPAEAVLNDRKRV